MLLPLIAPVVAASVDDARPTGLTGANWQFGPLNRWAYTHIREILPTKAILNDSQRIRPLPGLESAADDLVLQMSSGSTSLSAEMASNFIDGVLVLRAGEVLVERYANTLSAKDAHLLWSVSKTITGLTAASVAADGLIDVQKTVADYVPELAETGWGDNRLRALLDMRDTSNWNEDYAAADSTVRRQDCADGLLTGPMCAGVAVVGNYQFLRSVGRDDSREDRFVYKSGTTDVLAWVLESATGMRFADLVSQRIWKPMGAEREAYITADVSGFTLASGGMVATLRDVGRVGQLILDRGRVGNQQIVEAAWVDDLLGREGDKTWPYPAPTGHKPYYRSFLWGLGDGKKTVQARGVHGQYIDVSPSTDSVIVIFSSWPDADGGAPGVGDAATQQVIQAIRAAVAAES